MRIPAVLIAVALLAGPPAALAQSRPFDPKSLARYDASYLECEALYPEMKGHRDEAYLSLWRVTLDPKSAARLAETRSAAAYKSERQRASKNTTKTAAKASAPAGSSPLDRQCRGLWGEYQRAPKAKS